MSAKGFRLLAAAMVATLVFEGVTRKAIGPAAGVVVFFLKDVLAFGALLAIALSRSSPTQRFLIKKWLLLALLFVPVAVLTAAKDPFLMIFGLKQYLLFPVMALVVYRGFAEESPAVLKKWLLGFALLVIPTSLLAALQLRLGPGHWLNAGLKGESLGGFMAGGVQRISSTFPFIAQYSMFLNAVTAALASVWFFRRKRSFYTAAALALLALLFIVGMFATGSRSAVWGVSAILAVATLLLMWRQGMKALWLAIPLAGLATGALLLAREVTPIAFVAYDIRSEGHSGMTGEEEVLTRISDSLTGWAEGSVKAPTTLFGYGLGVMSNGSERVSSYARGWRAKRFWTETDLATTAFEGGYYLVAIWMFARLWVVWFCLRLCLAIREPRLFAVAAVTCGYISLTGILGTLGIQPPLAIWFWMSVGLILVLHKMDQKLKGSPLQVAPKPASRPITVASPA